jgi:hypothetical protein
MSSLKVFNTQTCPLSLDNISNNSLSLKVRNTSLACSSINFFHSNTHNYTIAVGIGPNGWLSYSTDNGVNWNSIDDTTLYESRSIAYNGKTYVAVGSGGSSIAYSNDLKTWTGLGTTVYNTGTDIKWTGKRFISVGNSGASPIFAYSLDGKTNWIPVILTHLLTAESISFSNDNNIVIGGTTASVAPAIIYSNDGGLSWHQSASISKFTYHTFYYENYFWAISQDGTIYYIEKSSDGQSWTALINETVGVQLRGIYSDKNILLITGNTNRTINNVTLYYSTDQGTSLHPISYSSGFQSGQGNTITKNIKYYVAGGDNSNGNTNLIIYSSDGTIWNKANDNGILTTIYTIIST